jgi:xanthine dehydrogenase YagS FAD-binding subunit
VAPHPWRATVAEEQLRGRVPDVPTVKAAVEQEMQGADLRPDNAFKAELAANLTAETLQRLAEVDET